MNQHQYSPYFNSDVLGNLWVIFTLEPEFLNSVNFNAILFFIFL